LVRQKRQIRKLQELLVQKFPSEPKKSQKQQGAQSEQTQNHENNQQDKLSPNINTTIQTLHQIYENCSDVIFHNFLFGGTDQALLIYIEGLSNTEEINDKVLAPLMMGNLANGSNGQSYTMYGSTDQGKSSQEFDSQGSTSQGQTTPDSTSQADKLNSALQKRISISKINEVQSYSNIIDQISSGNPVILVDKMSSGFAVGLAKWEKRSIEEPQAESVIRGPREGFIESIGVNTSLIRRKIKSPKLKLEEMKVGQFTKTTVVLGYIDGVANKTLIDEVKSRLNRIETDSILESEYLEEFIEDNPYSPFPQVLNTERPDVVAAYLTEGHTVILVDGSPFAIIAPITLYSLLQASEDYYHRPLLTTAIRWLRYLFVIITLLLPSFYVAVLTYHHEMVPTTLLISMAASREPIPFPALIEALLMEIMFEILREAGIRLPKQVGAAVSIVGALVIGQAAVEAGIVSAPMVMVVAVTGIASFAIPHYDVGMALRMMRFPILFLAGFLGFLGISLGIIMIVTHLCKLRSFGVPYLSPMAPMQKHDIRDVMIRPPRWAQDTRPHLTGEYNLKRQSSNLKPDPKRG
jgi:hypothetical protein